MSTIRGQAPVARTSTANTWPVLLGLVVALLGGAVALAWPWLAAPTPPPTRVASTITAEVDLGGPYSGDTGHTRTGEYIAPAQDEVVISNTIAETIRLTYSGDLPTTFRCHVDSSDEWHPLYPDHPVTFTSPRWARPPIPESLTIDGPAVPDMKVTCLREGRIWLYGDRGQTTVVRTAIVPPDRDLASLKYVWDLGSLVAVPGDWTRAGSSVDQEDWRFSWFDGNEWTQEPDHVAVLPFPDPGWIEGANTITFIDSSAAARGERMAWVGALVAGLGLGLLPQAIGGMARDVARKQNRRSNVRPAQVAPEPVSAR